MVARAESQARVEIQGFVAVGHFVFAAHPNRNPMEVVIRPRLEKLFVFVLPIAIVDAFERKFIGQIGETSAYFRVSLRGLLFGVEITEKFRRETVVDFLDTPI